jgi:hypothetical protein
MVILRIETECGQVGTPQAASGSEAATHHHRLLLVHPLCVVAPYAGHHVHDGLDAGGLLLQVVSIRWQSAAARCMKCTDRLYRRQWPATAGRGKSQVHAATTRTQFGPPCLAISSSARRLTLG